MSRVHDIPMLLIVGKLHFEDFNELLEFSKMPNDFIVTFIISKLFLANLELIQSQLSENCLNPNDI